MYKHKIFQNIARIGKSFTGWFFECKLHIVINHQGEIVSFALTIDNVNDRTVVECLVLKLK
ncbi:transposase [Orientia tsutsugamushi]|uniref:transposase n=1 Tax=Orientia tsutsugamushi TaxID=784 RepID=UPI0011BAD5EB